jgi:hypothetical protein
MSAFQRRRTATQFTDRRPRPLQLTPPELPLQPPGYNHAMEADQINLIQNALQDLAARSAEIRRYL